MIETVEKRREALETLADRHDLNCSKYAEALLEAVESEG